MKVDYLYEKIKVKADFYDNVNLLYDMSGAGKTFFFEIMKSYCKENNIKYSAFDFVSDNSENKILESTKGDEIIILDNADLYIDKNLLNKLKENCGCILISLKSCYKIEMKDVGMYSVNYVDKKLEVKRDESF